MPMPARCSVGSVSKATVRRAVSAPGMGRHSRERSFRAPPVGVSRKRSVPRASRNSMLQRSRRCPVCASKNLAASSTTVIAPLLIVAVSSFVEMIGLEATGSTSAHCSSLKSCNVARTRTESGPHASTRRLSPPPRQVIERSSVVKADMGLFQVEMGRGTSGADGARAASVLDRSGGEPCCDVALGEYQQEQRGQGGQNGGRHHPVPVGRLRTDEAEQGKGERHDLATEGRLLVVLSEAVPERESGCVGLVRSAAAGGDSQDERGCREHSEYASLLHCSSSSKGSSGWRTGSPRNVANEPVLRKRSSSGPQRGHPTA